MSEYQILLVGDVPSDSKTIHPALRSQGYQVTTVATGEAAIEALRKATFDLVITDGAVSQTEGIGVLKRAKKLNPETMVIILTGLGDVRFAIDALRFDVDDYILKPCELTEIQERVANCLEKAERKRAIAKSELRSRMINEQICNRLMAMSHDLRSPLVAVGSTLKLLKRDVCGTTHESAENTLNDLYERVIKLIGTAEDCLGKVCVVNGSLHIEREALDLRQDIVDPVLDELSADIDKHNIMIDNRLGSVPEDPIPVKASKTWLRAVYRNLVSNAIKYGDNGCSIALGYENHSSFCRLNVYNSGRSIPDECHGKLFTRFGRLDNNGAKNTDGLGLGLFLVKDIIQKHGGDIWYEAKEHGSNFVFSLPLD